VDFVFPSSSLALASSRSRGRQKRS
jgi:hypothetical protein